MISLSNLSETKVKVTAPAQVTCYRCLRHPHLALGKPRQVCHPTTATVILYYIITILDIY